MPVATGLVCDDLVCSVVTLLQVCAERCGTARADVSECLPLPTRQYFSPAIQELLTVLAEDIGDFQPRLGHRRRPSSLPPSIGFSWSASKGLWAPCSRCRDTRRYLAVVRISAWPSKTWMVRRSVPASSMWVAQAWRLCRMRHRRHTYATEMLRSGVGFPAVMKLFGHSSPHMTMRYLDIALTDLQREFHLARAQPRHLAPQPKASFASARTGFNGLIDSLLAAQHVLEMFRRSLPAGALRRCLDRLSNRLTKIVSEARNLTPLGK
jgi:hypothetical protein